jgi:hypothetical protein
MSKGYITLHERLHNLNSSPDIIRMTRLSGMCPWGDHSARILGDNIKCGLRTRWEGMTWIHVVRMRDHWCTLVNTVKKPRIQKMAKNFLTTCATIRFSRTLHHVLGETKFRNSAHYRAMHFSLLEHSEQNYAKIDFSPNKSKQYAPNSKFF